MGIGIRLQSILDEQNIKVSQLAKNSGIAPTTIYGIIKRDNNTVKPEILKKLCSALNISEEKLLDINLPTVDEIIMIREENRKQNRNDYFITWSRMMGITIHPIFLSDENLSGFNISFNGYSYFIDEDSFNKIMDYNANNIKNLASTLGKNVGVKKS